MEKIGKDTGVTRECVRPIQIAALSNLRSMLESRGASSEVMPESLSSGVIENGGRQTALGDKNIKRPASCRSVHDFKSNTQSGQRKYELSGRKFMFPTAAQDQQFR